MDTAFESFGDWLKYWRKHSGQWLEADVWKAICEEIDVLADGERIQRRARKVQVNSDELLAQRLKKQIEQKNSEADKLAASLRRASEIVAFRIEKQLEAIEIERLALETRLREIEQLFQVAAQKSRRERDILKLCVENQRQLATLGLPKRREFLELIAVKIFVERERIRLFSILTAEPIEILH